MTPKILALALVGLAAAFFLSFAAPGCKSGGDTPAASGTAAAVVSACAAPAAAELLSDATMALQAPEDGWRAGLVASAAKYGAEALNCALEQLLAGWASSKAISIVDHRSVDRIATWWTSAAPPSAARSPSRAITPQLTCQQCASLCHGAGACFNCCCLHQCG